MHDTYVRGDKLNLCRETGLIRIKGPKARLRPNPPPHRAIVRSHLAASHRRRRPRPSPCRACEPGTFSAHSNASSCSTMRTCSPGTFVMQPGLPSSDRLCGACDGSTGFQDEPNQPWCKPVVSCNASFTFQAATPFSNALCSICATGFYNDGRVCRPLTTCPAGTFVERAASPTSDRGCKPCPSGTFTAAENQKQCTTAAPCAPGTYVKVEGSATSARVCEACPSNTFSVKPNVARCTLQSVCSRTEYESTVPPSSTRDRVCYSPQVAHSYVSNKQLHFAGCGRRGHHLILQSASLDSNFKCLVRLSMWHFPARLQRQGARRAPRAPLTVHFVFLSSGVTIIPISMTKTTCAGSPSDVPLASITPQAAAHFALRYVWLSAAAAQKTPVAAPPPLPVTHPSKPPFLTCHFLSPFGVPIPAVACRGDTSRPS